MLQWWLGDGADGIVLTKKKVFISSNPDFFCKTSQPSFSDSPFKGAPFQNLGKSSKNMAILVLYSFVSFSDAPKNPYSLFP